MITKNKREKYPSPREYQATQMKPLLTILRFCIGQMAEADLEENHNKFRENFIKTCKILFELELRLD
jgi:hypothetical protein